MPAVRIVALCGDQTGQELLEEALRVLDPGVLGIEVDLARFDLSLQNRRRTESRTRSSHESGWRSAPERG